MEFKWDKMKTGFLMKAAAKVLGVWGLVQGGEVLVRDAQLETKATALEVATAFAPMILGMAVDWIGSLVKSKRKITP